MVEDVREGRTSRDGKATKKADGGAEERMFEEREVKLQLSRL